MSRPRAYLVDASIYIFRAWHARPTTEVDADGEPINALAGFAEFLLRLLEAADPSHLALVFDESLIDSPRHAIYPAYKAHRVSAPPALRRQCHDCRALARALGITEMASRHYEGDDVLATLASHLRIHGWCHTVVTGDKDLAQIVRTDDQWWDFERRTMLDMRGIERRFGVPPHRIADLLALAGDAGDNIPGVPGIGRPTAARLLRRWGDIETLLANIDAVRTMRFRGAPQVAERLAESASTVRLARRLTGTFEVEGLAGEPGALARQRPEAAAVEPWLVRLGLDEKDRGRWQRALAAPIGAEAS